MLIHEMSLHDVKVSVWCAMSATGIIIAIFLEAMLTFFERLSYCKRIYTIFCQQDITACTIPCMVCRVHVITEEKAGLLSSCLPDLKLCDFCFWEIVKIDVCNNNSCTEDSMKKKLRM